MKHLLEILKIVEGAAGVDHKKVVAYAEQLAKKLEEEGEERAAKSLRRAINSSGVAQLSLNRAQGNGSLPVDAESRLSLGDEEVLDINDISVHLDDSAEATIEDFVENVRRADDLEAAGVYVAPTLLLYGPPGCGKTLVARRIAAQLNLPLITARTDSVISSYLGSTAKNIRNLFVHASSRPCLLFLDEFDAVAKLRDDRHELGELKRVVISLLQNIDALDKGTVLLAATNHEHLLDPAVWRRFNFKLNIQEPNSDVRFAILDSILGSFASETLCRDLTTLAEGLSGAEIEQIAQAAKRSAVIRGEEKIDDAASLRNVLNSKSPDLLNGSEPKESMRRLRNLDAKIFTIRRLASLFDVSTGYVSNAVKESVNG